MKWIKLFEELEWDEPSYKKMDNDFHDSPLPKDLSLEQKDLEMIDRLSKELDFIYSKTDKKILITCYSDKFGKQLLVSKDNEDEEMYSLYDFQNNYEVDGRNSLEHLIRKLFEQSPPAQHIKFTVQELSLLKKLARQLGTDFKVPNKVSIFSKRFNSRFIIWKVRDDLYRMGFSQRVYSFQNIMELIKKIREILE
jgi:hypothetical protein